MTAPRCGLADMERFHDGAKAVKLYGERERQYAEPAAHGGGPARRRSAREAIRATHPTYFRDFKAEPYSVEEASRHLPWMNPEQVAS